jgi:hypothetical protein
MCRKNPSEAIGRGRFELPTSRTPRSGFLACGTAVEDFLFYMWGFLYLMHQFGY